MKNVLQYVLVFQEKKLTEQKRVLIVDDEPLALQKLSRYLAKSNYDLKIEQASNGLEAVKLIQSFEPEIIFLDIEMPNFSGFDVLRQFEARPFLVVFQTAYDEYAVKAFDECACDYLLKPFTFERFQKALERVLTALSDQKKLQQLETKLTEKKGYLSQLVVKQGTQRRLLNILEIICFISKDHYTCVYFDKNHEAIVDLSLSYLSSRLDPKCFQQLHRNNIICLQRIKSFTTTFGEMKIVLSNGFELTVSRSNQKIIRDLFKQES